MVRYIRFDGREYSKMKDFKKNRLIYSVESSRYVKKCVTSDCLITHSFNPPTTRSARCTPFVFLEIQMADMKPETLKRDITDGTYLNFNEIRISFASENIILGRMLLHDDVRVGGILKMAAWTWK